MIALARFIMAGPSQAALVAAVAAILALILPPLAWISGGVIALVVLHLGPRQGLQVIGFAGLAAMGLGWLAAGTPLLALGVLLLLWVPVWLAALVLRNTLSLGLALQLITGLGVVFVLLLQLAWPQTQQVLGAEFAEMIKPVIEQQPTAAKQRELSEAVDMVLPLMPGLLAAGMMMGAIFSLLLGRWWQAALYNPGGLAIEFNQLRLGRRLAAISTLLLLLAAVTGSGLITMLVLLLLSVYLVQGLALVHGLIDLKQVNKLWLLVPYIAIFLLPHLVIVPLAVLGLTDAWVDFRKRLTTN